MKTRVLIVARTRMFSDVCVGGITTGGESLRLLGPKGEHQPRDTPFEVGQVWEITYQNPPRESIVAPHVEDIYVTDQAYEKLVPDMHETLLKIVQPWQGDLRSLFDGSLGFTARGSGYIQQDKGIPDRSTWFWELDQRMVLDSSDEGPYYRYPHNPQLKIKYVGFSQPAPELKKGQLLRVSLARWWRPPDQPDAHERCYLQLSGWY